MGRLTIDKSKASKATKAMRAVRNGEVIAPVLRQALYDPAYLGELTVHFPAGGDRPPDGWFHPSEHPNMCECQLYDYLQACKLFEEDPSTYMPEERPYGTNLAAMLGYLIEAVAEKVLIPQNILLIGAIRPDGGVTAQFSMRNEELHERGTTDGLLAQLPETYDSKAPTGQKRKIATLEDLREKAPGWFAQGQRYMHNFERERHRVVITPPTWPFDIVEIVFDHDPEWNAKVDGRYRRALDAFHSGEPVWCNQHGDSR